MKSVTTALMTALTAAAALTAAGAASAAELRVGVIAHDVLALDAGVSKKEESGGVSVGLVTDPLGDRGFWLSPRFEIGADINLGGKTNLAYAGLLWRDHFGDSGFYGEFSFGLAIHDGYKEIPGGEPGITLEEFLRRQYLNQNNIEFGSDVLFRESVALGYRLSPDWSADVYLEHFSHGKILSSGSNEGLDVIGLRISRRLY